MVIFSSRTTQATPSSLLETTTEGEAWNITAEEVRDEDQTNRINEATSNEISELNTPLTRTHSLVEYSQVEYSGDDNSDSDEELDQWSPAESVSEYLADPRPEQEPLDRYIPGTKRQAPQSLSHAEAHRVMRQRLCEPSSPTLLALPHLRERLTLEGQGAQTTTSEDEQLPWSIVQPGEASTTHGRELLALLGH
ncbi:hypothetical protein BJ085DRAFT_29027 [Dimargaris cristalligena]|uniref:Uncharacterized protein n=1 Tax=Dimargaris cristalligena TaxID=215637 RepID=A0A4P9ZMC7_9FUNG|nr:hypothetical protein BJ085DRAFT_29027 [Dimargaris cristalligena]|eukprot:RKP33420.1 hypothetical protein BJ085DRAFT_29027 [Dimargaris cristalligena]